MPIFNKTHKGGMASTNIIAHDFNAGKETFFSLITRLKSCAKKNIEAMPLEKEKDQNVDFYYLGKMVLFSFVAKIRNTNSTFTFSKSVMDLNV